MYNYRKYYERTMCKRSDGNVSIFDNGGRLKLIYGGYGLMITDECASDYVYLSDGRWTYDAEAFAPEALPRYILTALDRLAHAFLDSEILDEFITKNVCNRPMTRNAAIRTVNVEKSKEDVDNEVETLVRDVNWRTYLAVAALARELDVETFYDALITSRGKITPTMHQNTSTGNQWYKVSVRNLQFDVDVLHDRGPRPTVQLSDYVAVYSDDGFYLTTKRYIATDSLITAFIAYMGGLDNVVKYVLYY